MIPTPSHTTGPFFPSEFIRPGDDDLSLGRDGAAVAGDPIVIEGVISDGEGDPVVNAIVELWQVDASGLSAGPKSSFKGWGRTWTDDRGRYRFRTIKPGFQQPSGPMGWVRPPFISIMVLGSGLMRPLVTEAFFPDEPLNDGDRQLRAVTDERARRRLILEPGELVGHFILDIRLRGSGETPFLVE